MIDASFFTKLETVARYMYENLSDLKHAVLRHFSSYKKDFLLLIFRVIKKNDSPFGGIQLILCGDFLQLPPVTKGNERRKFAFQV